MATWQISTPSGRKYEIDGPDNATAEQVKAVAMRRERQDALEEKDAADNNPAATGDVPLGPEWMGDHRPNVSADVANTAAGYGKSFVDLGRGVGQLVGVVPQEGIDESRRLDAPLMQTKAGLAGNIAGGISQVALGGLGLRSASAALRLGGLANAGNTATGLGRALLSPSTYKAAAATGAGLGLLQPTASGDLGSSAGAAGMRLANAALGAAAGTVGMAIPRGIGAVVRGAKSVLDPLTNAGQERIAARTIDRFAANPDALMNVSQSAIPGVQRTTAEATLDPGLAQLQRAMASTDEAFASDLAQQHATRNAAHLQALGGIAGDEARMAAAETARSRAAMPLLSQATAKQGVETKRVVSLVDRILAGPSGQRDSVVNALSSVRSKLLVPLDDAERLNYGARVIKHYIDGSPRMSAADFDLVREARRLIVSAQRSGEAPELVADSLKALKPTSKGATDAINSARKLVAAETEAQDDVAQLYGVRKHIDDMMSGKVGGESASSILARRELMSVKAALDHQIGKVAPEFKQYLTAYKAGSEPINQMQVGQEIVKRTTGQADILQNPVLSPAKFNQAMKNGDQLAARATGFKRATLEGTMTPDQMRTLRAVGDDLSRQNIVASTARPPGSDTAKNLAAQNVLREFLGPLGVPQGALDSPALAKVVNAISYGYRALGANDPDVLRKALLSPAYAQRVASRLPLANRRPFYAALEELGSVNAITAVQRAETAEINR